MSTLYVVGTPIGNLEDITLRALRILKEADIVLSEDTRVTKRLLNHYGIKDKLLLTYNEEDSGLNVKKVAELLQEEKKIALVSDAGTPGISDPGSYLVQKVREHFQSDKVQPFSRSKVEPCRIEAVPGPSALTAALSIAGLPSPSFVFLGFLPHKKGRETLFKEIASLDRTAVFYESPHRILKTLAALAEYCPEKKTAVAREITKIYEQVVEGEPRELLEYFEKNPDKVRGEFVVLVSA
jgi:16S rRNA (cytidine1402-2'-O)-methyltransferase